ncbi:ABC transporter ATP-binding protein [Stygiobacter electus]|uniref:ABC transporter ATP-binding protein n=1 Tax=Stygiobacter electus TaxID=3032292 RepID=A0AAE3NVI4_9BACT|nr:ABC transporter ATP-binding protein [Stygiobacter electus]MDF1611606.1 ABC transporter ATP-binding protein [Stygiobacter electus]
MNAIEIINISKTYKSKTKTITALNNISLEIKEGELFGLIGPDGAGKSSLFRILATVLLPDVGSAKILNYDVIKNFKNIRKLIGYMPGRFSLYQDLSVEENLKFFATIFETTIEENYDLISDIYKQIEPFKNRRAGKLSGGMKQKLALSCALIHKPKILLLDEPTTGVDPVSRKEFWEILKKLKSQGITILVSTPYMDEANLCDRIALIQNGKILDVDLPENIVNKFDKDIFSVASDNMFLLLNDLRNYSHTLSCFAFGDSHHLVIERNKADENLLIQYLSRHKNLSVKKIEPTIEDCFMQMLQSEN